MNSLTSLRIAVLTALTLPLSTLAAVPTGVPSGGVAGGTFSTNFNNLANNAFSISNTTGGSTQSVCGVNGIIVGFNTVPGSNFLSPQCKNLNTLLPSLMGTILTATTGGAGQAVTGFNAITGAPVYSPISSQWTGTSPGNIHYNTTGNVGIGTATPTTKLDVTGTITSTLGSSTAQFRAIGGTNPDTNAFMIRNDGTNTYFLFSNAGSPYGGWNTLRPFRIDNATANTFIGNNTLNVMHGGNVGIGTTTPAEKLDVAGGVIANSWYKSRGDTGWYSDTYGGGIYMTDTNWVRTYAAKSFWTNNILGSNAGLTVGYNGQSSPSGGAIINGNVGIGTNSPSTKLDVTGDIRATGNATIQGNSTIQGNIQINGTTQINNSTQINGNTTTNQIKLNTVNPENTPCSDVGTISRNASGKIVSCQAESPQNMWRLSMSTNTTGDLSFLNGKTAQFSGIGSAYGACPRYSYTAMAKVENGQPYVRLVSAYHISNYDSGWILGTWYSEDFEVSGRSVYISLSFDSGGWYVTSYGRQGSGKCPYSYTGKPGGKAYFN